MEIAWFQQLKYLIHALDRQILVHSNFINVVSKLVSDVHLQHIRCWVGPGGGKNGVRDLINVIIDLLAFPFVVLQYTPTLPSATASISSGSILNTGLPGGRICVEDKEMVKAIEKDKTKYIKILLEVSLSLSLSLSCMQTHAHVWSVLIVSGSVACIMLNELIEDALSAVYCKGIKLKEIIFVAQDYLYEDCHS